jgi:DNA-binding transcriptional ArsR family regulator
MAETSTTIRWDIGTAYEMFVSLRVLHEPEMFGLRASWAAGVRSRIPAVERKFLEDIMPFHSIPLAWVHSLPAPKDAINALWALRQLSADKRISTLMCIDEPENPYYHILLQTAERRTFTDQDVDALFNIILSKEKSRLTRDVVSRYLDWWSRPEEFGETLLSALQAYYQAFFEEEEKRVRPVLEAGLARAQTLATQMNVPDLLAELSQGVRWDELIKSRNLIIAPAYWTAPLILFEEVGKDEVLFMFGARPANMSAIPGETVPDSLVRTLKAIADPTRLKILYYLAREELSPSELSRRLHLRAPTVTHHLNELRLAGLVNLTINGQEKLYTTRREALKATCENIDTFLDSKNE